MTTKKFNSDFTELLTNTYLSNMAESHLEAWEARYKDYRTQKALLFDLKMNHDDSLEVERVEEDLERKLTDTEYSYLIDAFHKAVVKEWKRKGIYA